MSDQVLTQQGLRVRALELRQQFFEEMIDSQEDVGSAPLQWMDVDERKRAAMQLFEPLEAENLRDFEVQQLQRYLRHDYWSRLLELSASEKAQARYQRLASQLKHSRAFVRASWRLRADTDI